MKIRRQEFETEISEIIGQHVNYFKVSGRNGDGEFEPVVFWMNTGNFASIIINCFLKIHTRYLSKNLG